jgi:hypothetical protein
MIDKINSKIEKYDLLDDIHEHRTLLDASDLFIQNYPSGVNSKEELLIGIKLVRKLVSLSFIASMPQYEHNYDLQNDILVSKVKVFKLCISESHSELRGLTELILGMKENSLG